MLMCSPNRRYRHNAACGNFAWIVVLGGLVASAATAKDMSVDGGGSVRGDRAGERGDGGGARGAGSARGDGRGKSGGEVVSSGGGGKSGGGGTSKSDNRTASNVGNQTKRDGSVQTSEAQRTMDRNMKNADVVTDSLTNERDAEALRDKSHDGRLKVNDRTSVGVKPENGGATVNVKVTEKPKK